MVVLIESGVSTDHSAHMTQFVREMGKEKIIKDPSNILNERVLISN